MGVGTVALVLACAACLPAVSYLVEATRKPAKAPSSFTWAPQIAVRHAHLGTLRVRYLRVGSGPNLVLLHTLRTQLDIFQKLIPPLASKFTVYAFDFPGHGWSDIPPAAYAPEDFYGWTAQFLDELKIEQCRVAGISIGGTIALVLAARGNPRISHVIAINPYDYWPLGGIRRSSLMARLILGPANVPILGASLMRLRNRFVSDRIMRGGVVDAASLPPELARDLYLVGNRPGQYSGFLNLLAHEREWPRARDEYAAIKIPSLLIYGEQDWAPTEAQETERRLLPRALAESIPNGGHFLVLDQPTELSRLITHFLNDPRAGTAGTSE